MPASFEFSEANLVGEAVTDGITNLNYGSNDSPNLNTTTYPITKAASSYEKYIKAHFYGTFTSITNMLFWKSAGTLVTGESITAAANATYAQPSQTPNGDSAVPTVVGSALAIQASGGGGTISAPGYTKYVRLQLQTTSSIAAGSVNTKTFTFQYDES
jgi:hypothetical protein